MRGADCRALGIDYQNRFASSSLAAIDNIAGENPRMSGYNPIGSFSIDANGMQTPVYRSAFCLLPSRLLRYLIACRRAIRSSVEG